jgi:hypothetical protein
MIAEIFAAIVLIVLAVFHILCYKYAPRGN